VDDLPKRIIVFLVHGTWPRGLPIVRHVLPQSKVWFDQSSQFAGLLRSELSPHTMEFRAFEWSGNNSILDRAEAAKELAKELSDELQSEDAFLIIIGHSHGGNVAVKAAGILGQIDRQLLVTMGTPFLRASVSSHFSLLFAVVLFSIFGVLSLAHPYMTDIFQNPAIIWFALFSNAALTIAMLAAAIAAAFCFYTIILDHNGYFFSSRRLKTLEEALSNQFFVRQRMLAIRAVEDETSVAMMLTTASHKIISVLQSLYGLLNRTMFPKSMWQTILAQWLIIIVASAFALKARQLNLLVFSLAGGVVAMQLVRAGLATVFGREMFVGCSSLNIWATDTPDAWKLTLWSLPVVEKGGLRHSMHESRFVPPMIALWIKDQLFQQSLGQKERKADV
jgi:Alpha/beta hydrolase family